MSRKHTDATVAAAVSWFHRFRLKGASALPPEESADWARWSKDESHFDEFSRAKQLWDQLGVAAAIERPTREELDADEYDPSMSVSDWLARGGPSRS